MPTMTRPPAAPVMPDGISPARRGDGTTVGAPVSPPEVLLPSGGPDRIETWGRRRTEKRTDPSAAFERRVRAIHRQLLPLRSRTALASSYQREGALSPGGSDRLRSLRQVPALHVAYALRWLELGDPALGSRQGQSTQGTLSEG